MNLPAPPPRIPEHDGHFPFGRPNGPRPAREPRRPARQLVLGVYPSALHVRWARPDWLGPSGPGERGVSAMAVDAEPCVFWRGDNDESCADAPDGVHARVERWKTDVGFRPGNGPDSHGQLSASPLNGPSGQQLDTYFAGLDIGRDETVLADVYPVFLVHRTARPGEPPQVKNRKQGDAIDAAYNPIAGRFTRPDGAPFGRATLPTRPTGRWDIPDRAVHRFGDWLKSLFLEASPDVLVTLGQEPWDSLTRLGAQLDHPADMVADLRMRGYGTVGSLRMDGRTYGWLPMPHPGLLLKAKPSSHGPSWRDVHEAWTAR